MTFARRIWELSRGAWYEAQSLKISVWSPLGNRASGRMKRCSICWNDAIALRRRGKWSYIRCYACTRQIKIVRTVARIFLIFRSEMSEVVQHCSRWTYFRDGVQVAKHSRSWVTCRVFGKDWRSGATSFPSRSWLASMKEMGRVLESQNVETWERSHESARSLGKVDTGIQGIILKHCMRRVSRLGVYAQNCARSSPSKIASMLRLSRLASMEWCWVRLIRRGVIKSWNSPNMSSSFCISRSVESCCHGMRW